METLSEKWKCLGCGRDKFPRPYMPHNCFMGYLKHFRKRILSPIFPNGMFVRISRPYWGA